MAYGDGHQWWCYIFDLSVVSGADHFHIRLPSVITYADTVGEMEHSRRSKV